MFNIISVTNEENTITVVYEVKGSKDEQTVVIRKKREGLLRPSIDGVMKQAISDLLEQIE